MDGSRLEVETGKWINYNDYTKVWYSAPGKSKKSIIEQVENIKPDILYIIGLFSWHYNIVPLLYCKAPRKIISARGMLHAGALSQKRWKKKIYLGIFKLLGYHHKVQFHATNGEEKNYINQYFGDVTTFIAENFPTRIDLMPVTGKECGYLRLVSIALISPMKNILLVLEALGRFDQPILRQAQDDKPFDKLRVKQDKIPQITYDIYGPIKDEKYWEKSLKLIDNMPKNITVKYHGDIQPSRVKEALNPSHVFILPSRSENFGHAIYEALSAGRPVITSHTTPWKFHPEDFAGINVSPEQTDEMETAINFFADMNQQELSKWSLSAHEFAMNSIDFSTIKKQYLKMFSGNVNRQ